MKKYLLLLALSAVVFTSCDKEDDEKSPSELILGKWSNDRIKSVEYLNGVKVGENTDTEMWDLTFTSNTFLLTEDMDTADYGTYSISETKLTVWGDDTASFDLLKLTEDQLTFYLEEEYTMDTNTHRYESTYYFEK